MAFGAAIILQHTEQRDGVNVDGGGKNAAEVHGEERVNGRDWDCHDQIATHTGDGDNGFDRWAGMAAARMPPG